ncbi:MAG: anti-sigma factor domain-containing protein [Gammaproteobacteria bacterium]
MTEEHTPNVEDLAAYALESLESDERDRVERHVAECSTCAPIVAGYRAVVGTLPVGLRPVPPPPRAWSTIRAAARPPQPRRRRWTRAIAWPALAAAAASLLVWNVILHGELARRSPGPAPGPDVEALSRRPGRLVIFAGTGVPGANARLFVAVDGGGHLAVSGLRVLPRERTYQLWFVRKGDSAASGSTFTVDASGRAWAKVTVPAPFDAVRTIMVTEEPVPGSGAPTGQHLLDALPWR